MATATVFSLIALCCFRPVASAFNEFRFNNLVAKVEGDALDFARKVEDLFNNKRCSLETYSSCVEANYDECSSQYPKQECPAGPNFFIQQCTGLKDDDSQAEAENVCSGLYDFSISTVRIPAAEATGLNGNPTKKSLFEAVCATREIDGWLQERRLQDAGYWAGIGVEPRAWYFGSSTGAFRIWPARHRQTCGLYDPRLRPWFVAGSSGPKNIVLIIDTSGSMDNGNRFNVAKQAAIRIVSTLTVSDRITIVTFSDTAQAITDDEGFMLRASQENKDYLVRKINELYPFGNTNFGAAFELAFSVFETTLGAEKEAQCNSAVLFLTDGKRTEGPEEEQVTQLVTNKTSAISARIGKPVLLFTYSISQDAEVHKYPSALACAVDKGVWSKIGEAREILDALSSYYRLFALGLGSDANKDFVAWVEPYVFATGSVTGTTVSVPVYDRSHTPYLFVGVVAVDFTLQALDAALGGSDAQAARDESIARVVKESDASCPPELNLTKCELQAWSQIFEPEEGPQCGINCSGSGIVVEEQPCQEPMPYPSNLFHNFDLAGISYEDRVCCAINSTGPSDQCPSTAPSSDNNSVAIAVSVSAAGFILLVGIALLVIFKRPSPPPQTTQDPEIVLENSAIPQ